MAVNRREFVSSAGAFAAAGVVGRLFAGQAEDALDVWQRETDCVKAEVFRDYMEDGDTRGLASLEKLERAFEKVFREARETAVGDVPAVWSVYNMGYVVKTHESLFSIDLHHRRALEFAPLLDFALITHNHGDHYRLPFYQAMNGAGKTVVSNFLDNYGAADWRKGGHYWDAGGYARGVRTFSLRDVEIRTSLVDHNQYLVDFTTAFEIRVGSWRMYHSGDCGNAAKLGTVWGAPDLWTFFPGCGVDVAEALGKIGAKKTVFGHLWELGHATGRLMTPGIRAALAKADSVGAKAEVAFWGDRIS